MSIQKTLYVCLDQNDIFFAENNIGPEDAMLVLKDSSHLCNKKHLIAEDFDDSLGVNYFPKELEFMLEYFNHNANMIQIFGFYHSSIIINAIQKNISSFDKVWIDLKNLKFSGPVYFDSSFEGGNIGRKKIKSYVTPIILNKFKNKIHNIQQYQNRINLYKIFKYLFLKFLYLISLSIRSYFLKNNKINNLSRSNNIVLFRSDSQLSIFRLMSNEKFNYIKIPVVRELFKKTSIENSIRLGLFDLFYGMYVWVKSFKKFPEELMVSQNTSIYKQLYYETYIASIENFVLEKWINKFYRNIKNNNINEVINLEFRSPQSSVFYNCAKKNNISVKQYLVMDIYDMKIDLPYKFYGDKFYVPSLHYQEKFKKLNVENIEVIDIFEPKKLQNLKNPLIKKYKKIYLLLKIDITEYQVMFIKNILSLCNSKNIPLKLRPHPRGIPDQIKFIKENEVEFCYENWNDIIIDDDEIIIVFYSAALFEVIFYNFDFLLVDEGRSSFTGIDLSNRLVESFSKLEKKYFE